MNRQNATQMQQQNPTTNPLSRGSLLQRKCESCGQHAISSGSCSECQKKRSPLQRRAANLTEVDEVPAIVQEVLNSPGHPLDTNTRTFMESRFRHDFSQVQVHSDAKAARSAQSVNALAYTVNRDIVFGQGQYTPKNIKGHSLLAHELTHVIQQQKSSYQVGSQLKISQPDAKSEREADNAARAFTNESLANRSGSLHSEPISIGATVSQPTLQRREYPDGTDTAQLKTGDWTSSDRVNETARWQTACLLNLINLRPQEYTQPHERRDFYLWFYNYTSGLGWQTRWPLAAYLVASGAAHLSYGFPFSNQVQIAARQGNQIIFDDVFPKLRVLLQRGPLTGAAAQEWDAQTLSDEQQTGAKYVFINVSGDN